MPKGIKEIKATKAIRGISPAHRWVGSTQVQLENPDGTWGDVVDLNPEVVVDTPRTKFEASGGTQEVSELSGVYRPQRTNACLLVYVRAKTMANRSPE